jgi:tetratricopeptide (TPR) repeat protein
MFFWILLVIVVAILAYFSYLFLRHLPDVKNLDVNSIAEERQIDAKNKLLEAKLARHGTQVKDKLDQLFSSKKGFFTNQLLNIRKKVQSLEEKYHGYPKEQKVNVKKTVKVLLAEAEDLINSKDYATAEKNLIEVLSRDDRNIDAYELLGELYMNDKQYNQAEEIYQHLLRLITTGSGQYEKLDSVNIKNDDLAEAEIDFLSTLEAGSQVAFYYSNLGEVCEFTERLEGALDNYLKATTIEPDNPKYLDKLIEVSIESGDRGLAKKTFNHIKKINPDNTKLDAWQRSIAKI